MVGTVNKEPMCIVHLPNSPSLSSNSRSMSKFSKGCAKRRELSDAILDCQTKPGHVLDSERKADI
jgi:hypothetical protein